MDLRFQRPLVPLALTGRNLANPAEVSDAELLSFLGETANVPGGSTVPAQIHATTWHPEVGISMVLELQTNRSYQVQYTPALASGTWIALTNFISTNALTPFVDPGAAGDTTRIYRVVSP